MYMYGYIHMRMYVCTYAYTHPCVVATMYAQVSNVLHEQSVLHTYSSGLNHWTSVLGYTTTEHS